MIPNWKIINRHRSYTSIVHTKCCNGIVPEDNRHPNKLDHDQPLFFVSWLSKTRDTQKPHFSHLARACACTPLTKSKAKERLFVVYLQVGRGRLLKVRAIGLWQGKFCCLGYEVAYSRSHMEDWPNNLVLTKRGIDVVNTGNNMKVIYFCKEAKQRLSLKQRK